MSVVLECHLFLVGGELREYPVNKLHNFFLFGKLILVVLVPALLSLVHALICRQFLRHVDPISTDGRNSRGGRMRASHSHEVDTGPLDLKLFVSFRVIGPRIVVLNVNLIDSTEPCI